MREVELVERVERVERGGGPLLVDRYTIINRGVNRQGMEICDIVGIHLTKNNSLMISAGTIASNICIMSQDEENLILSHMPIIYVFPSEPPFIEN